MTMRPSGTIATSATTSVPMAMAVAINEGESEAIPTYPMGAFGASAPPTYNNKETKKQQQQQQQQQQPVMMMTPVMVSHQPLSDRQMARLREQGYSRGLAKSLELSKKAFALHFWIVDNSGSMQTCDGHRMVESHSRTKPQRMISCSRWEEIQETVEYHIRMAGLLEKPTRFRLLNDPGAAVGPQQFAVASSSSSSSDPAGTSSTSIAEEVQTALRIMQRARPGGCTPLTQHILEIHHEIRAMTPTLRATGQRVTIQIATDGLPSDLRGYSNQEHRDEFVEALRSLEGLPVWVVIRLCTDEESVVDFYNDLDSQLELSMEVLDDFTGEAHEVQAHNPWFCYSLVIHRMREMGFHDRVFDLLDERTLTKSELREFCYILFGEENMDGMPDPNVEWREFCKAIERLLRREDQQWDPVKKRMSPWIDMKTLNRIYGDGSACCIM
jgi:hypothetical protein